MKYFVGCFLSLVFASNLFASNLCDSSCDLSITFPDGGSIEAIDTLTIIFGDGGTINNGVVTTVYPAGDTLTVAAGDFITFDANGSFVLGDGGNIDYSSIQIMSNGVMNLAAVEGAKKVLIQDLTLLGGCALNISSDFEVIQNGMFHIFSGPVTASTDLAFTSYGSVSGSFEFESATLTLDTETFYVTGAVLIEADGNLTMTSKEVVIEPAPTTNSATEASASASGGLINILSLLLLPILLVLARHRRFLQ